MGMVLLGEILDPPSGDMCVTVTYLNGKLPFLYLNSLRPLFCLRRPGFGIKYPLCLWLVAKV